MQYSLFGSCSTIFQAYVPSLNFLWQVFIKCTLAHHRYKLAISGATILGTPADYNFLTGLLICHGNMSETPKFQ